MGDIERSNPYNLNVKNPEIICEIEKNYRICRRFYQSLHVDIADAFIQYIHLLEPDEMQQLDDDIRANVCNLINCRH